MSDYIGTREQVDEYVGSRLVEAAYLGSRKYYDAYSEVSGSLPLIFESRVEHILKNYRIYGTSEGAGAETENEFNPALITGYPNTSIGAKKDHWTATGSGTVYAYPIEKNTDYCLYSDLNGSPVAFYRIAITAANRPTTDAGVTAPWILQETAITNVTFNSGANTKLLLQVPIGYDMEFLWSHLALVKTDVIPDKFIPYGYKLPLTVTSGAQSQDYPIYIGSTKLGAEEYLDYESGKVYKRTENLLNPATTEIFSATNLAGENQWTRYNGEGAVLRLPCDNNTEYTLKYYGENPMPQFRVSMTATNDVPGPWIGAKVTVSDLVKAKYIYQATFTTDSTAQYLLFQPAQIVDLLVLCKGDTAPKTYIPYLQPTDPPIALPAISTYQGENTLSSTETLGECSVTGRINSVTP